MEAGTKKKHNIWDRRAIYLNQYPRLASNRYLPHFSPIWEHAALRADLPPHKEWYLGLLFHEVGDGKCRCPAGIQGVRSVDARLAVLPSVHLHGVSRAEHRGRHVSPQELVELVDRREDEPVEAVGCLGAGVLHPELDDESVVGVVAEFVCHFKSQPLGELPLEDLV